MYLASSYRDLRLPNPSRIWTTLPCQWLIVFSNGERCLIHKVKVNCECNIGLLVLPGGVCSFCKGNNIVAFWHNILHFLYHYFTCLFCLSVLYNPHPHIGLLGLGTCVFHELCKEGILERCAHGPLKRTPGIFLKSRIAKEMWSFVFTCILACPLSSYQRMIFRGSMTSTPKCAPPLKQTVFFFLMKLDKTCWMCSGNVGFCPPSPSWISKSLPLPLS